jgi:protein-disulfide isomerase
MTIIDRSLLIALLLSGIAMAQPAPTLKERPSPLPTEDTVNSFLFQMKGFEPTISWKVTDIRSSEIAGLAEVSIIMTGPQGSSPMKLLVSADGKYAISGDIFPFGAKPFEDARAKLEKGVTGPSKGPAKAAVTIVEFSDMQCPHCQKAAPAIEQLLGQEPEVRFVFQNFPLPAHDWADKAAGYVDCVGRSSNEAVWKFIQKTFDEQTNITAANVDEKLKAIATASGVNGDEAAACAVKPDTRARVDASVALGKAVGVTGTPTLFIEGRSVPGGAPVDVLKKIVDFQISQAKGDK